MAENSTTMRIWNMYNNIKEFYNEINGATLTGAIDVVVVEQPDGSFTCSPFHVRFGKLGVLRSNLKVVDLELNGVQLDIHMKLGESGEAFFVEEVPEDEVEASAHLATSPIPENGFSIYQEQMMTPRRTSEEFPHEKYENQVSDFSQRRYTDGQNSSKPTIAAQKMDYQMLNSDFMYDYKSHYSSSQMKSEQDLFVMDNEKDQSEAGLKEEMSAQPGAPKRFRAEELSDKESLAKEAVRKISINNDFKPISIANEEIVIKSIVKSEEPMQVTPVDDMQKMLSTNKKKKKSKKSGSKKKSLSQRKLSNSSNGYSSQSESTLGPESIETDKAEDRMAAEQLANKELIKNASFSTTNLIQDHFFSDTDIPSSAPRRNSRSGSPVQSDSELELARGSGVQGSTEPGQSWRWGELPSPLPMTKSTITLSQTQAGESLSSDDESNKINSTNKEDVPVNVASQTSNTSMLSGMLNFIKPSRSSKYNNKKATDGVYLQELAAGAIEPEVAALYFPTPAQSNSSLQDKVPRSLPVDIVSNTANEEDYESGNGPSLTQSPSSVEGLMGKGMDSDEDEIKIYCKGYIGLSLCGPAALEQSPAAVAEAFEQDSVKFEMLCSDPALLQNPRLVVRIGSKYMPWSAAAPTLLSLLVYHRPLPKSVIQNLIEVDMKDSKQEDNNQGSEKRTQQTSGGFTWWSWRRSADKQTRDDSTLKGSVDIVDGKSSSIDQEKLSQELCEKLNFASNENIAEADEAQESLGQIELKSRGIAVSTQTSLQSLTDLGGEGYSGSQSAEDSDECTTDKGLISEDMTTSQTKSKSKHSERFRKTLRLSSDEIKKLNLREGMNEMDFSVTTAFQGTTRCKCYVFRWRYDDKIVISDIDGTITKSDVLGHIFPLVGKDWSQSGVAQLFTKIENNGYKLLYLSARAIGQAKGTRDYLRSIKQGDVSLPDGPLLLNPTSLLRAFHREVIEKKPEEFKIQCLSDIKALFPEDTKPFYAGYGNRVNDVCAYQAVGIPIVRIFTINHKGELKHELTQTFQSSYSNMSYIVDHLFPPVQADVCEDFSQFVFWRQPIADLNEILPTSSSISSLPPIPECSASNLAA